MARRAALVFLAVASPLILVSFLIRGVAAEYLFTMLAMAYPVALIVLAVARADRIGPLGPPLAVLLVLLEACGLSLLVLRDRVIDGPWIGGLPIAAAIQLVGLWLAPLLVVALAYPLTFEHYGIEAEDLERLDAAGREPGGEK